MKKILIIGANGFTGRQILNDLSVHTQYKVTGVLSASGYSSDDAGKYRFIETDYGMKRTLSVFLTEVSLMWSLIVPPCPYPDYCETHHEEAYLTNVTAVSQLADFLRRI